MYGIRKYTTMLLLPLAGYALAPRAVQRARGSPHVPQKMHKEVAGAPSHLLGQAGAGRSPPVLKVFSSLVNSMITHKNSVCLQRKDEEETGPRGSCCMRWGRTSDAAASLISSWDGAAKTCPSFGTKESNQLVSLLPQKQQRNMRE